MEFTSKKDIWLVWVLILSVALGVGAGMVLLLAAEPAWERLVALFIVLLGVAPLTLIVPIRYIVDGSSLHVRSGLLHWHIPLKDIRRVVPTRDSVSSPALSFDRLRVEYDRNGQPRSLLISPENTDAFLRELTSAQSLLVRDADGAVRRRDEVQRSRLQGTS